MKQLYSKIKNSKGETLVETLVAMMVMALVSSLLFVMITGAHKSNVQARTMDTQFYTNFEMAETQTGTTRSGIVKFKKGVTDIGSANVQYFGNEGLRSYKEVP